MPTREHKTEAAAPARAEGRELPYAVPIGKPFQERFGPSRSVQYELIENGDIESFVIGDRRGRRFIVVDSYLAYIKKLQTAEEVLRAEGVGRLGYGER